MSLVVRGLPIAHHGHNVRERRARSVILVRVEENTESLEVIRRSKDRTRLRALFGEPHGEPITVEVSFAVDFEFEFNLPS